MAVVRERVATVCNREGLHFRPIMKLVDAAARFGARITMHVEDRHADVRSPMELLMLMATQGTRVRVVAEGDDAEQALSAVVDLIETGFNETIP